LAAKFLFTLLKDPLHMRRMLGVLSVCIGAGPLGVLHVGWLADRIGGSLALTVIAVEGLVALLVLAFARPFTTTPPGAGNPQQRIGVFVLDRSVSMLALDRGETAWDRALDLTREALRDFKADDLATVVTCSARTETLSGPKPAPAIARLLDDLEPEFGSSDLAEGLRAALRLLPSEDADTTATIYVVSDLQKSSAQNVQTVPIPQDVEVKLLNSGGLFAPNVAIGDLRLEGHLQPFAQISAKSFSHEEISRANISVAIDGEVVTNAVVSLPAGAETNVVLTLPAFKPGWHSAAARIETKDALGEDNVRYHAFFIPSSASRPNPALESLNRIAFLSRARFSP